MIELFGESELTEEQHGYLRTCRRAGEALLKLIDDILDLSKVEAGQLTVEAVPFDVRGLMRTAVQILMVPAGEKGLRLQFDIDPIVPPVVIGDPHRLRQVLINIVGNAIKFTHNGHVRITVHPEECDGEGRLLVQFAVADTGIGIAEDKHEEIFETFKQADASTTRQYGGAGLGLAIAKQLVEAMGGSITIESRVGHGTVVRFTARFTVPNQVLDGAQPAAGEWRARRILLVCADPSLRVTVHQTVRQTEATVIDVVNTEQALVAARYSTDPYDAILIDGSLQEGAGLGLAEALAADLGLGSRTVLMLDPTCAADLRRSASSTARRILKTPLRFAEVQAVLGAVFATIRLPGGVAQRTDGLPILLAEDSDDNPALVMAHLKSTPHQIVDGHPDAGNGRLHRHSTDS